MINMNVDGNENVTCEQTLVHESLFALTYLSAGTLGTLNYLILLNYRIYKLETGENFFGHK